MPDDPAYPALLRSKFALGDAMALLNPRLRVLATILFAGVAVACASSREGSSAQTTPLAPSGPIASLEISLAPARTRVAAPYLHRPIRDNVAMLGSGLAYFRGTDGHLLQDEEAHLAIDGDEETIWSGKQGAPHWYSILLGDRYEVDRVEMVITQSPPGPTTHEVWLGHGTGLRTIFRRLANVPTEDGQTLSIAIDPPHLVDEVLIVTLHSPSWVAWRELRVFGKEHLAGKAGQGTTPFQLIPIARELEQPVLVTNADDGSGRIFVLEQKGRVRVVEDGTVRERSFLDISERVLCCGERGLLGLAFPPTSGERKHFYLSYSDLEGHTRISRFLTSEDPYLASEESEEILLTIYQPHNNHNGGHLEFGPKDGYLYIGSGDGGKLRDPDNRGQDPDTILGKILRIDVESGALPYSIPVTNPYRSVDEYRDEIWALGLRNPWGFAFDEETGDLFIPDTGQDLREEVNFQSAASQGGENYGWPIMEGNICFEHVSLFCTPGGLTHPVAEFRHSEGCAVVGGAVYRNTDNPALDGLFVFADFCTGQIWGIRKLDAQTSQNDRAGWHSTLLAEAGVPISSIGKDADGNLYAAGYADGTIYMLAER